MGCTRPVKTMRFRDRDQLHSFGWSRRERKECKLGLKLN